MTLHKEGYSDLEIGFELHFSKTAVHNSINNFSNYGTLGDM